MSQDKEFLMKNRVGGRFKKKNLKKKKILKNLNGWGFLLSMNFYGG